MERELLHQEKLLEFYPKTSFTILSKGRVVNISIIEITHVSKYGNETVIYTSNNNYRTYHSIQEILNDLPVNDFFRVHKSHVISLKYMNGVKRNRIVMGEYQLPVSKYYKLRLLSAMKSILNEGYKTIALHENRISTIASGHAGRH